MSRIWCFHFQLGEGDLYIIVPCLKNCLGKSSLGLGAWKSFFWIFCNGSSDNLWSYTLCIDQWMPLGNKPLTVTSIFWWQWEMDLAIVTTPTLISSELLVLVLLVPQCITTDLIDFDSTILLMCHKTFSVCSLPIHRLIVLYGKMKFLHTQPWELGKKYGNFIFPFVVVKVRYGGIRTAKSFKHGNYLK